jgi:hypothetical protein
MQMWEQATASAHTAVVASAKAQHDFEFAPSAYTLVFFLTCGLPGQSFEYQAVQRLLEDADDAEDRLQEWGMKDHVMFGCHPKRWLIALRAEWDKALGKGKHAAKVDKPQRVTLQQARQERAAVLEGQPVGEQVAPAELPKGHLPVTDWRVWDQRYFGYYTWLEPPMQPEPQKCAMCGSMCIKVHRRAIPGLCLVSVLSLLLSYQ